MQTTAIATINAIISTAERYKNCYFWNARGTNASQRRREEFDREYEFTVGKDSFKVRQSLSISCANYYFSQSVTRNGKTTNITPIKTALRKLTAQ